MILKELDPFTSDDPMLKAGRAAEEQMAFYLHRAFNTTTDLLVLNGLRLEDGDDAAQMDHVIFHRYGAIIVESKSVSASVEVNDRGEWIRWYGRTSKGMPSPIQQARRQGEFLKHFLIRSAGDMRGRFLWMQKGFRNMPVDVIVAVSDTGIIKRSRNAPVEYVLKADQVVDRVRAIQAEYSRANSILGTTFGGGPREPGWSFDKGEMPKIVGLLVENHRPAPAAKVLAQRHDVPQQPDADTDSSPAAVYPTNSATAEGRLIVCRHCMSQNVAVEYGRYGYYLKCQDCQGNTALQLFCSQCGGKERTRKAGLQFFRECPQCGTSRWFHTNAG